MPGGVADRCLWDWFPTEPLSQTRYSLEVIAFNGTQLLNNLQVAGQTRVDQVIQALDFKNMLEPGKRYELVHKAHVMKEDRPLSYYFDPRCSHQRVTAVRTKKDGDDDDDDDDDDGEPSAKMRKLTSTRLEPK